VEQKEGIEKLLIYDHQILILNDSSHLIQQGKKKSICFCEYVLIAAIVILDTSLVHMYG